MIKENQKRQKFIDSSLQQKLETAKFLYYPMTTEPEARILLTSPFYTNQIALIENIAKSLPLDYKLYVKEHPLQKTKNWRSIDDYKSIMKMPNVILLHPSTNNAEIIEKSTGVIAISGGTAFEAIFYKKPVILFGQEYYDCLPMVTKIDSLTGLPETIHKAITSYIFDEKKLAIFMDVYHKNTINIPYHAIMNDGSILAGIQRLTPDLTPAAFEKFYNKYKVYFGLILKSNKTLMNIL